MSPVKSVLMPSVVTYVPRAYPATAIPTRAELHVIDRLGCGYSRATLTAVRAAGGIMPWLDRQLDPASVPEAAMVASIDSWFAHLRRTPAQKYADNAAGTRMNWQYGHDLGNWSILRRVHSTRTVHETFVDFWSNHLHISTGDDRAYVGRWHYDAVIRKHAFGRFEDMLIECSTHPAMSLYLDNWRSVKDAPNENQGRELLELHTVTRAAGFTEAMVKASARLLSGYSVQWGTTCEGFYDAANHTIGAATVLGFTHANASIDGRAAAIAYLKYLANHPATARNIATKLATRFVVDVPSDALISHLASVYLASGTDIKAVIKAMVTRPEFAASVGQKVRTPVDDLVATARVLGPMPLRNTNTTSYAQRLNYHHGGARLYSWPRPDGAPDTNNEWISASRMIQSFRMHWDNAGGYYPTQDVAYRKPITWIPQTTIRFDEYVDHLYRCLTGKPSTARTLKTACLATGLAATSVINRNATTPHPLTGWMFPRLAVSLLDSHDHMTR